MRATTIYRA
uniref:Uncharacterized protein n=1 Tax=Vitis vinifera TaxID=29760 RepID=F6H861_VITVI